MSSSAGLFFSVFAIILWMLVVDWLPEPKHKRIKAAKDTESENNKTPNGKPEAELLH